MACNPAGVSAAGRPARRRSPSAPAGWHRAIRTLPLLVLALLFCGESGVFAADLRIYCPAALREIVVEVSRTFQRESGHRVGLVLGAPPALQKRVASGEGGDVIIGTASGVEALIRLGRGVEGTKADLGSVGVGVAVRAGAPRPDLSTPDAFRQAMLAARSVAYADPGLGGLGGSHALRVFDALGISGEMKPKTAVAPSASEALKRVAAGEAELGIPLTSEIVAVSGAVLAGPFPTPFQERLAYAAGVIRNTSAESAARAYVAHLATREARARFRAAGFETPE